MSAANKALSGKDAAIENFRRVKESLFDTTALERERAKLTGELNAAACLIQDGIRRNAGAARNRADYRKNRDALAARYKKAKKRLDETETKIRDRNACGKFVESYLAILEERRDAVTEYDAFLWRGVAEYASVYGKDDIRFAMKDGTEIRA